MVVGRKVGMALRPTPDETSPHGWITPEQARMRTDLSLVAAEAVIAGQLLRIALERLEFLGFARKSPGPRRETRAFRRRRERRLPGVSDVQGSVPMRSSLKTEDTLGVCQVAVAWAGAKPFLRRAASSEQDEPASGAGLPHCQVPRRLGAGRPSKRGDIGGEAGDGVVARRGLRRTTDEMMRRHSLRLLEPP